MDRASTRPEDDLRRALLKRGTLIALLCGTGVFGDVFAAGELPFNATLGADVLRALGAPPVPSDAIELDVPELTENGAMVPIAVKSRLPRTTQIVLLADANPFPLVASFEIATGTEAFISTRVKLANSCMVSAIVRADGKWYSASRETAVTLGGCGG